MSDQFDIAALRRDNPLSSYLPTRGVALQKNGREWRCKCPLHADGTPSFTVYTGRKGHQLFRCFGCDANGDVVEFVSRFDGVPFAEACAILGGERAPPDSRPPVAPLPAEPDPYAGLKAIMPPVEAPFQVGEQTPPLFNPKKGTSPSYVPTMVHAYRMADGKSYAYVLRYLRPDGKKAFATIAWCRDLMTGKEFWSHWRLGNTALKRIYGLEKLTARPHDPVIVVEGEKCADVLGAALPSHVVVAWHGGSSAAKDTNWQPLAGRDVTIWTDRDEPGRKAVEGDGQKPGLLDLIPAQARVARPDAIERKSGWDPADAVEEGWTGPQITAWLDAQTQIEPSGISGELRPQEQIAPETGIPVTEQDQRVTPRGPRQIPGTNVISIDGGNVRGQPHDWRAELEFDTKGRPDPKRPRNHYLFLLHHPRFKGVFCKNTFTGMIVLRRRPPWDHDTGPWVERGLTDDDVTRCTYELDSHEYGNMLVPYQGAGVAISAVAETQKFNPVADYLRGLRWDGVGRLYGGEKQDGWLCHYFGTELLTYHRTVGMRWMIAGAARALSEGTAVEKVDTMLILEGPQGYMKSSALEVLGTINGEVLYTDNVDSYSGKDAAMSTNGKLIVEVQELVGMSGRNVDAVKKWLSTKVDRYRPPYGKNMVEMPRRFIAAGTVNPSGTGYLHDATGARRFWPVTCGKPCDIVALERDRDQLWAEAVHLFLAGEQWWLEAREIPDAEYQQGLRYHNDPWADRLDARMKDAFELSLSDLFDAISMPLHRAGVEDKRRIADHMKTRRWTILRDGRGERWQKPAGK